MKLGIEIARTARVLDVKGVITWKYLRPNAVWLARCTGHTHAHTYAHTYTHIHAQANSCMCEYILARTSSAFEARSYCALSGGKCVRLTRGGILRILWYTWCRFDSAEITHWS